MPVNNCEDSSYTQELPCARMLRSLCYEQTFYNRCCATCEAYRTRIPDCVFGDRVRWCHNIEDRYCYDSVIQKICCQTCRNIEDKYFSGYIYYFAKGDTLHVPSGYLDIVSCDISGDSQILCHVGCEFGDRSISIECLRESCSLYTPSKRRDCCYTCFDNYTTTSESTTQRPNDRTATFIVSTRHKDATTSNPGNVISESASSAPAWVIPLSVGLCGAVILALFFTIVILYRRQFSRRPPSPITSVMYKDYKLGKRPPLPQPRDNPNVPMDSQDGDWYTYINQDDHGLISTINHPYHTPYNETRDSYLHPTTAVPGAEFLGVDKYGYLKPIEVINEGPAEPTEGNNKDATTSVSGAEFPCVDKYGYLKPIEVINEGPVEPTEGNNKDATTSVPGAEFSGVDKYGYLKPIEVNNEGPVEPTEGNNKDATTSIPGAEFSGVDKYGYLKPIEVNNEGPVEPTEGNNKDATTSAPSAKFPCDDKNVYFKPLEDNNEGYLQPQLCANKYESLTTENGGIQENPYCEVQNEHGEKI